MRKAATDPNAYWVVSDEGLYYLENLDKMFLLRCALPSGRRHNLMKAIVLKIKAGAHFSIAPNILNAQSY